MQILKMDFGKETKDFGNVSQSGTLNTTLSVRSFYFGKMAGKLADFV